MDRARQLVAQQGVDRALSLDPALTLKGRGNDREVEMALAAGARVDTALMVVSSVPRAVVLDSTAC